MHARTPTPTRAHTHTSIHSSIIPLIPPSPSPSSSLQANCIDSTAEPEKVFAGEIKKMLAEKLKPQEQITLEPYERDHAVVIGMYRPVKKAKD